MLKCWIRVEQLPHPPTLLLFYQHNFFLIILSFFILEALVDPIKTFLYAFPTVSHICAEYKSISQFL